MNSSRKVSWVILLVAVLVQFVSPSIAADDAFKFEFDYDSRSFVDSTRRDWQEYVYDVATTTPIFKPQQYDKTFMGSSNDITFAFKSDFSETHFLDIKEKFYYRHYNDREPLSRDYNSYRYRELDHLLNVTWGIAAGDHDYFQFDFYNNVFDLPDLKTLSYKSNRGSALASHEFSQRTCFSLTGSFEERQYDTDLDADFREGRAGFEIASLLPGHYKYIPVANSTRGDKNYFAQFPGAMSAKKAIDYYTDFAVNPRDDDPRARYQREKTRGNLFLKVYGDLTSREYTRLDNKYSEVSTGFEAAYEAANDVTLRLGDTYRKTDYDRESGVFFLHDRHVNNLSLSIDYDYSANMAQTLSFSDELQKFSSATEENFRINALTYEGFFSYGKSRASLLLGALRRRYDQKRLYYPDEDELRTNIGYDYLITESLRFRTKSEFVSRDYLEFEDYLYSTHSRNSWRVGLEKSLSSSNSLELAYQENNERNDLHYQNNVAEKTIGLSWLSNF